MTTNYTIYFRKSSSPVSSRKRKSNRDITVAAVRTVNAETNEEILRFGSAICSTKENFVKAKGRAVALGRAKSNHPAIIAKVTDPKMIGEQFKQIASDIYKEILG